MSYQTRVRDEIKFISPEYNTFTAFWRGGDRNLTKKLGTFDPPGVRGSIIQDLDTRSMVYPLTVYFSGLNHDKDAKKFFNALFKEKGVWEITHPIHGILNLQLVSAKENNNPVTDGGITVIEMDWLEPALIETIISTEQLAIDVLLEIINTIQDTVNQLKQLRSDLYSAVQSGINAITAILGFSNMTLAEMAATDQIVNDAWNSSKSALIQSISDFQNNPSDTDIQDELLNNLIDVIATPLGANSDYTTRMSIYSDLLDEFLTILPTGNTAEDFNKALFVESGIIAALISACRIIVTSNFGTRAEVLSAIDNITTLFNDAMNAIETVQDNFI